MPSTTQTGEVKTFLRATLKDGSVVVSAFSKLANVQRYAAQVFARANVFNAWQIVGRVHPASGEPCLIRRRRMISGDAISEMEKVTPITFESFVATHSQYNATEARTHYDNAVENLDPEVFESALDIQAGQYGAWTPPTENAPEGSVPGMRYPIHRDPQTLVRFVILRTATADVPELRLEIETPAEAAAGSGGIDEVIRRSREATGEGRRELPGDADDDIDDDGM